jgi:hypothetical protein
LNVINQHDKHCFDFIIFEIEIMEKKENKIYNGEIVAGSLLIEESRKIARLLLEKVNSDGWHQAIVLDNILQKRSPATAIRQVRLIKNRLTLMDKSFWQLVHEGSSEITSQALLAASIKHSHLVGDFMATVIRQHWQTFQKEIRLSDWFQFLDRCAQIDPQVEAWKESTRAKLKQIVFRILAEAKYIDNTRTCKLLPVSIAPEVKKYLVKKNETYVLSCMEIT